MTYLGTADIVRGSITIQLTPCFTGLDTAALYSLNYGCILTGTRGGQLEGALPTFRIFSNLCDPCLNLAYLPR